LRGLLLRGGRETVIKGRGRGQKGEKGEGKEQRGEGRGKGREGRRGGVQ